MSGQSIRETFRLLLAPDGRWSLDVGLAAELQLSSSRARNDLARVTPHLLDQR